MKKTLTLLLAAMSMLASAQTASKLDATARRMVARPSAPAAVTISTTDAARLAGRIAADGYHARAVSQTLVTAVVPADYLKHTLQHDGLVKRVNGSHKLRPLMDKARKDIGVETIRESDEFETPFTGKGVLIGMIDTGFKFNHISFQDEDGNSRFRWVWERAGWADGVETQPTDSIPSRGDGVEGAMGHATHTTGIAAGSVIAQNHYSGVAPEASIVAISSSLEDAELLEDIAYIAQYAHEQDMPCVMNMSLGTTIGPHDGLSPYDRLIDSICTSRPGQAIVMAAGNSGSDRVHTSYEFTEDGERVALSFLLNSELQCIDLWCDQADSLNHLEVEAYIGTLKKLTDTIDVSNEDILFTEIADYNKKQHVQLIMDEHHRTNGRYAILVVTGQAGTSFNAWTDDYTNFSKATFIPLGLTSLSGNSDMSISGFLATAEHGFGVANYVTKTTIHSLLLGSYLNMEMNGGIAPVGHIEHSSSHGPTTNPALLKPDVAAPGAMIAAPIDDEFMDFQVQMMLVDKIDNNGEDNYFAAMVGTSMASPMVAGTIALWLQANPRLTNEQLHDIVRATSRHDEFTHAEGWSPVWGYGKIDAYEGLRMALALADESGIASVVATPQPVSLKKTGQQWRVLFNNTEPYALIDVVDMQGRVLTSERLDHMQRGEEHVLNLATLPHGLYTVRIRTAKSDASRKFIY